MRWFDSLLSASKLLSSHFFQARRGPLVMKSKLRTPAVSGVAISLSAVVAEAMILAVLMYYGLAHGVRSDATAIYVFGAAGVAALVLFVAGTFVVRRATDHQHQVDRDLLDAFLEHIPDNVFFKDRESRFVRISRAMAGYCGLADPAEAVNKTDLGHLQFGTRRPGSCGRTGDHSNRPGEDRDRGEGNLAGRPRDLGAHHQSADERQARRDHRHNGDCP